MQDLEIIVKSDISMKLKILEDTCSGSTMHELIGQIHCILSMRESLTIRDDVIISNKWLTNFT